MSDIYQVNVSDHELYRHTTTPTGDVAIYNSVDQHPMYDILPNFTNHPYPKPEEYSEYLSRKFSKMNMYCWVLTIDPISYGKNRYTFKLTFVDILLQLFVKSEIIKKNWNFLAFVKTATLMDCMLILF